MASIEIALGPHTYGQTPSTVRQWRQHDQKLPYFLKFQTYFEVCVWNFKVESAESAAAFDHAGAIDGQLMEFVHNSAVRR